MRFVCKLCGENFDTLEEAVEHVSKVHRVNIPKAYVSVKAYDEEEVISSLFSGSCVITPKDNLEYVVLDFYWVISCTFRASDLKKLTEEFNTVFSKWLKDMEVEEVGIDWDDYRCYFSIRVTMSFDKFSKMFSELYSVFLNKS